VKTNSIAGIPYYLNKY